MNKRRLSPDINQYPENQITFTKVLPQPTSYGSTVKSTIKVAMLCDSIRKTLSLYHMKKNLDTTKHIRNVFLVLTQIT